MKNRKIALIILGIMAVILTVISLTYAYWLLTRAQRDKNVISTACLDIDITAEKDDILLTSQYPMSDSEGVSLKPYTFTVTNNCDTEVDYQIALELLESEKDEFQSSSIKAVINNNIPKVLSDYSETETTLKGAYEARILDISTLSASGSAGSSETNELRIWIDTSAPSTETNKTLKSKITVTAGQGINKSAYDYEIALSDGEFLGTLDKYILEEEYGLSLGTLVNYEEPESLGYDGTWRVLGVNEQNQIMLVSSDVVGTMELAGKDGYNNGPDKLDSMCAPYANKTTGVSARSIRVEDLNELVGYNPEKELTGFNYQKGNANEYGARVTYKKISDNVFEYTKEAMDGTVTTTEVPFNVTEGRTGEFLDINSSGYLKTNETITMDFKNNYYVYRVTAGVDADTLTDQLPTYFSTIYTLDDTLTGNVSRANYEDLFFAKDNDGNIVTKYWLANKSELAHNGGAGWGIRVFDHVGTGGKQKAAGHVDRITLYHAAGKGDIENGLKEGEYSGGSNGVRAVVTLDKDAYFVEQADGTYNVMVGNNPNDFVEVNTEKTDEYGNTYVIPTGFKEVTSLATNVTEGIVIKDRAGNEFVWVPTGTVKTESGSVTITLGRYQFSTTGEATTYKGTNVENETETTSFLESVEKYNGYYIARHEARINTNNKISTNPDCYIKNRLYRNDALSLSKTMYKENDSFATNLMNSYAWDTAIVFIQTFESDRALPYSQQYSLNNGVNALGFANKGTIKLADEYKDIARNIYDMASNNWEWTTESSSSGVSVYRGSNYQTSSLTTSVTSQRGSIDVAYPMNTFRPVLYIK